MMLMKILRNKIELRNAKYILIAIDDMIADMLSNKIFQQTVTGLFIRVRKLNISLIFITLSYFAVPKNNGLTSTYYSNF